VTDHQLEAALARGFLAGLPPEVTRELQAEGERGRLESAIGAPRPGQPQDWQHRVIPKGFVSERHLNLRAPDQRIYVTIGSCGRIIAGRRYGPNVRGASTPKASTPHPY
jgi:hypothetical protein